MNPSHQAIADALHAMLHRGDITLEAVRILGGHTLKAAARLSDASLLKLGNVLSVIGGK